MISDKMNTGRDVTNPMPDHEGSYDWEDSDISAETVSGERLDEIAATAGVRSILIPVEEGFSIIAELKRLRALSLSPDSLPLGGVKVGGVMKLVENYADARVDQYSDLQPPAAPPYEVLAANDQTVIDARNAILSALKPIEPEEIVAALNGAVE